MRSTQRRRAYSLTVGLTLLTAGALATASAVVPAQDGEGGTVRGAGTGEIVAAEALAARAAEEHPAAEGLSDAEAAVAAPREELAEPPRGVWDRLAVCESSSNWASQEGFYEGGLQFHPETWDALREWWMPHEAYNASRAEQIAIAERLLAEAGWSMWPACSAKLGLR